MIHQQTFEVRPLTCPMRLDRYLAAEWAVLSRSQLEKRLVIELDGRPLKRSYRLVGGEVLTLRWCDLPKTDLHPQEMVLDIIFEDQDVVVINKARGMVVHPAHGHWEGTLVQALLYHVHDLKQAFEQEQSIHRPGIVHRLDKETTGILITAKRPEVLEYLAKQFRQRTVCKRYLAVLKGILPKKRGELISYLGRDKQNRKRFALVSQERGKVIQTSWLVLDEKNGLSLVEWRPLTGRTHQLRVHAASMQAPILGDPLYARKDSENPNAPLMLHAWKLSIQLPREELSRTFVAPIPHDFKEILNRLELVLPIV